MKMLSIQQLIKALRKLQNSSVAATTSGSCGSELTKQNMKHVVAAAAAAAAATTSTSMTAAAATGATPTAAPALMSSLISVSKMMISPNEQPQSQSQPQLQQSQQHQHQQNPEQLLSATDSSQENQPCEVNCQTSQKRSVSFVSYANENGGAEATVSGSRVSSLEKATTTLIATTSVQATQQQQQRSQQIQNFYQQHLNHFHTQHNQSLYAKQKQTQYSAMSSLAAEPCSLKQSQDDNAVPTMNGQHADVSEQPSSANGTSCNEENNSSGKPCFNTGLGEILQFMELIGNLKHTKRTGWVLRDVIDCESISGHMYRMSMMTFLLDGSEGLNQIRCMELALVHDLAESLVGDITPFCGVSKTEKRAMEFKAMEDICKLIEPRGKRIMELFEEYETGESAESKFVKDLDRLDMVMQAFEYEKRDNCLLKHQEFFDSTEGKFKHPFVKKLVGEIYAQRRNLARAAGATPPPPVHVPDMEDPTTNGHNTNGSACNSSETSTTLETKSSTSSS